MTTPATISAGQYLPKAILAGVAGVVVCVGACAAMGGSVQVMVASGAVVAIAAILGIAPAMFATTSRVDRFGLVVLGATMAQTLLAIGAAFFLTSMFELPRRPLVMGVFAGVFLVMMLHAITAAMILNGTPKSAFAAAPSSTDTNSSTASASSTGEAKA